MLLGAGKHEKMQTSVPNEVATFFDVINGADPRDLNQCFAEASVVRDEQKTHEGLENIVKWFTEAQQKYQYSAQPVAAIVEHPIVRARAKVSGSFPGSPIELEYVFELSKDRISRLEIRP